MRRLTTWEIRAEQADSSCCHRVRGSANISHMSTASTLLREAREAAGLTQAALARRAGIPRSVLNAYERDHRQPGAEALADLLRAAGFELRLTPRIDLERNARILKQVLDLAAKLPYRPRRTLAYPPLHRRLG